MAESQQRKKKGVECLQPRLNVPARKKGIEGNRAAEKSTHREKKIEKRRRQ